MITTIDLTEEQWSEIPDPSRIFRDDDDIVLQFREVHLRFTYLQFVTVIDACHEWIFRDLAPATRYDDGVRDVNDESYVPEAEHARLRDFIRGMIDTGTVGVSVAYGKPAPVTVPGDVIGAMRSALANFWREDPSPGYLHLIALEEVVKLRGEVERLDAKRLEQAKEIAKLKGKIELLRGAAKSK